MKILVVEDEPLIRLGVVSQVEDAGFAVVEAANADEAIRVIEREDDIGVVITDVDMPGTMDGVRLTHFIRSKWPPIRMIVISGKVGVKASDLPSGTRFFTKPCQEAPLLNAVRELSGMGGTP
ncbi:MAG TPA: response regulator [Devosia sp.]|nr:response regulator [Devosia sp.]